MNGPERALTYLLRLGGVLTGSAVFAVFLPEATMARIHADLGLGPYPAAPITDYMARSLSAMYAIHGVVLFALAADVRRYRRAIAVVGWGTVGLGALLTGIDLHAPMPLWWTLAEGPWVVVIGFVLAWLAGRVREIGPRA